MPEEETGINTIGQLAIPVKDLCRAIGYYRDVLRLKFLFQAGELAFFQCGQVRLMLSRPEREEFDHPASLVYYRVNDLAREFSRLESAGAEVVEQPHRIARFEEHELWMAFFRDSEGNHFALMEEKPIM